MKILIDTREQKRLSFCCNSEVKCLKFGDYACMFSETYQYPVVFERKNKADLFGSLTKGYDRLRACFKRAEEAGFKMIIVIEGSKEKILKGYDFSARDPESIIKQLETIKIKYGVEHLFFHNRAFMSNYIVDFYNEKYEKWKQNGERKESPTA